MAEIRLYLKPVCKVREEEEEDGDEEEEATIKEEGVGRVEEDNEASINTSKSGR